MTGFRADRSSERRPLDLMVKGRVQSRVVFVDLVDISEGGCKIKGSRGFAKEGDRITMKVGDISAPLGTVAWVQDRFAGVRFDGEMHPAVLDHLVATAGNNFRMEKQRLHRL
ncbi:PilZ domain-containing protein [Erythrobacter aurantius]|uniref:PilZ domain-containing protein n=1 Tax=Erythrobacter aurantius TaxID=2909249 RepID=UPI00207993AA|nr:PilZ domain-containing protein [Erythrobacter aurantius]